MNPLSILVAAGMTICSDGINAFPQRVAEAQQLMEVKQQLYVRVHHPKTRRPYHNAAAWVYTGYWYKSTIHIRADVLHAAGCKALDLMAYHEVCHIKLGHHLGSPNLDRETEAEACSYQYLGRERYYSAGEAFNQMWDLIEEETPAFDNFTPYVVTISRGRK